MGQLMDRPVELEELKRISLRKQLDELDYKRALKAASAVATQVEIAKALGLTQPAVHSKLKTARSVEDAVADFGSGSPLEACKRFAAGLIGREELVHQLKVWPYKMMPEPNEYGEYEESTAGTFNEVIVASHLGLIDGSIYSEVSSHFTK